MGFGPLRLCSLDSAERVLAWNQDALARGRCSLKRFFFCEDLKGAIVSVSKK